MAHQIINTGSTTMRYLALSTLVDVDACEYPDSQKVLVVAGKRGERGLRKMFRAENTVDYYDREKRDVRKALARYNGSVGRREYPDLVITRWTSRWRS